MRYCATCQRKTLPKRTSGQIVGGFVLLLFFLIPGILYLALCEKKECSECRGLYVIGYNHNSTKFTECNKCLLVVSLDKLNQINLASDNNQNVY